MSVAPSSRAGGFEAFYRANYHPVLTLAYALTGRWAVAEEIAQEAFVRALDRWGEAGALRRPDAWVRTVAANLARSHLRRLGIEMRALARIVARRDGPQAEADPAAGERDDFWAAARRLPRRQAQAVALYYLEDRPVSDVARVMGCAEGTAKSLLHHARRRLSEEFGRELEEER